MVSMGKQKVVDGALGGDEDFITLAVLHDLGRFPP